MESDLKLALNRDGMVRQKLRLAVSEMPELATFLRMRLKPFSHKDCNERIVEIETRNPCDILIDDNVIAFDIYDQAFLTCDHDGKVIVLKSAIMNVSPLYLVHGHWTVQNGVARSKYSMRESYTLDAGHMMAAIVFHGIEIHEL